MILSQFPDLQWLKQKIDERFQQRRGYNNMPLDTDGFPSVIINTQVKESYRPDVVGPISLFLNLQGTSRCSVEGHTVSVPPDYFFVSNRFQSYTLEIESRQPVETFNIHIGEVFSEGVLSALLTPADTILNNGLQQKSVTVAFHNQLYRKDERFHRLVAGLRALKGEASFNKFMFEEHMTALLHYLLAQHRDLLQQVAKLPAVKQSTRLEVYRRLSYALDYLHAHADDTVDLDALAASACLSRYHFLRLFKLAYGLSPYQYWQSLRLEKARHLLRHTSLPVEDIAFSLGFENSNSLSRLFHQRLKMYPTQYRQSVK
jgi:AraC family transcriptional regulator